MAGIVAAVAGGIVGAYVVVKRIVFISGGISHAALGGVGLGMWLGFSPVFGAFLFSVGCAVALALLTHRRREQPDVIIGALWAFGMALGIMFMGFSESSGEELTHFLIGDISLVAWRDLAVSLAFLAAICVASGVFFKEFTAIALDAEFAELRGVPVLGLTIVLFCLVASVVVMLIQLVGIILVLALLTLPPATSRWFTRSLGPMMGLGIVFGLVYVVTGAFVAYTFALPLGVCIVLAAILGYFVGAAARSLPGGLFATDG